jgi:NAD(P)-dependent dehydrogenase (short-subunit alcohol dehydrogenase family)
MQTQQALSRFQTLLVTPHHAFPGAAAHELSFAGIILAPDLIYPSGPIETLPPDLWHDSLNSKVLYTISTAQAFLPIICEFKARVLVLTPNVVASLKPAFHGMESAIVGALEGFTTTLRRELRTLGICVCQIKLGNFDFSHLGGRTHMQPISASRTFSWAPSARMLYAQNFINQGRIAEGKGLFGETGSIAKASSPRELHYAIFDALTQKRPSSVWRVGRGSLAYDIVGNWVPGGLVGWVLGLRTVSLEEFGGPPAAVQQSGVIPPSMEESVTAQSWEKIERGGSPGLGA